MATITKCDKCKKEIVEKRCKIDLESDTDLKGFDLCKNCYQTLIRVLAEYLP